MTDEEKTAADAPLPGGNFRLFVQKLGYQALISMGLLDNPITNERSSNLSHAESIIDDLRMLRDKTAGNLEKDEKEHIEKVVSDLQHHFVTLQQKAGSES
ncbi:MAG: hypothetical protein CMJ89_17035 [Planctomycetes bacterium]|jgi:hypothetical protein|nr:hypothetical protein [Planctomycetota bacterium]